jgi:hypothetical protein
LRMAHQHRASACAQVLDQRIGSLGTQRLRAKKQRKPAEKAASIERHARTLAKQPQP